MKHFCYKELSIIRKVKGFIHASGYCNIVHVCIHYIASKCSQVDRFYHILLGKGALQGTLLRPLAIAASWQVSNHKDYSSLRSRSQAISHILPFITLTRFWQISCQVAMTWIPNDSNNSTLTTITKTLWSLCI